jgi:hypothetical protein
MLFSYSPTSSEEEPWAGWTCHSRWVRGASRAARAGRGGCIPWAPAAPVLAASSPTARRRGPRWPARQAEGRTRNASVDFDDGKLPGWIELWWGRRTRRHSSGGVRRRRRRGRAPSRASEEPICQDFRWQTRFALETSPNFTTFTLSLHFTVVIHFDAFCINFTLAYRWDIWGFYLYAIIKDGTDLCAIKKFARTCVPFT